jgi:hypothetical protein
MQFRAYRFNRVWYIQVIGGKIYSGSELSPLLKKIDTLN